MDYVKNNRALSLLGQRGTFGTALFELAKENEKIFAVTADLTKAPGLERMFEKFPDRCVNVGIAEQNAVGFAAGLADAGKIPFVTTFSNFATMRANEFVRHFMSYMECNVKLVGLGSGFAMELFGNTHYGLEDIAALRSFPGITILSPSDCLELTKCVKFAVEHAGPVYIRLSGRMNNPIVNRVDYEFVAGKGRILNEGGDAVIYATGSMVSVALKASRSLEADGIRARVANIHTIKPIDCELIRMGMDRPLVLTVEEHAKIGGLGSAVAEALSEEGYHGKVIRMGTKDRYEKAGAYGYMLARHGLTVEGITSTVKEYLQ